MALQEAGEVLKIGLEHEKDALRNVIQVVKGEPELVSVGDLVVLQVPPKHFKDAKKLTEVANGLKNEQIFCKLKTYEQARNKALEFVGDLGPNSKPYIGRLGIGRGKVVGRQSSDGLVRWRLDYDPSKGPHINVENFSKGKKYKAIKIAIPFDGNLNTIESLLRHLNK